MTQRVLIVGYVLALMSCRSYAQTAYPMLMSLRPVAAKVGATSEHTLRSRYSMLGAYQVLVTGDGVRGEVVALPTDEQGEKAEQPAGGEEIKVRFHVAPGASPGVRDFRIATPQGASTVGQLVVVDEPVVTEATDNNSRTQAERVELPATICGCIEANEDVDNFRFQAAAGQALSFQVRAQRLQDRIHDLRRHVDPILTLRDANGATRAVSDNYFNGDPFLHFVFPETGDYYLEIRDVRYQGDRYWEYCVEVSDKPFLTNLHPLGIAQGQAAKLQLIGYQLTARESFLHVSHLDAVGPQWKSMIAGDLATNPAPLVVSDLPVILEGGQENDTPDRADSLALPVGISGRIERPGDIDCFAFAALQGERFSFEVLARRHQSGLDSQLRILDSAGKQLALNDDMQEGVRSSADSCIENWTAPADGVYVIELRDLHLRGGDQFVYFIQATRSRPYFQLFLDTDKTQLTPGTNGVIFARVVRKNGFTGEVQLHIGGLPDGVQASCGRILAGPSTDGCIVLAADARAQQAAANVTIWGTAAHPLPDGSSLALRAQALPYQETYQPGGGRGLWPVEMHTVAIGQPSDIRAVKLSRYELRLQPGESGRIDISIERTADFDKNVTLDVTCNHLNRIYGSSLPAGVTLDKQHSKTLLTGSTVSGHITLTAAADTKPVAEQLVPVMANVSLNFVMKATYAARPLSVTVVRSAP